MTIVKDCATCSVGQSAKAVVETAHALACARREWVINEKKLVERCGLQAVHARFADVPTIPLQLRAWVDDLRRELKGVQN